MGVSTNLSRSRGLNDGTTLSIIELSWTAIKTSQGDHPDFGAILTVEKMPVDTITRALTIWAFVLFLWWDGEYDRVNTITEDGGFCA